MLSWTIAFAFLTIIFSSNICADKDHISSKLSLVNVPGLNYLLRLEIFVSEDGQLRVAHLVLDYEPLLFVFQEAGQALKTGSSRLAWIDVSKPGFLAQRDLSLVPQEVAVLREETASVQLSLEVKIDQFHLEDEEGVAKRPVELLDSEIKSDRFSTAYPPKLIVAYVSTSSEEEEEGMDLKQRTSLRGLIANWNKGKISKEALKT